MAGGAYEGEDLTQGESDLVPPLLLGFPRAVPASIFKHYWGERATKVER